MYPQVLVCEVNLVLDWVNSRDGTIEPKAIVGGRGANGEKLYIGRVLHENTLVIGKIHPKYKCMFIPFHGQEIRFNNYEILVAK
jgi:hypothetical protein